MKFCLTVATALLALTAFSYGQDGDEESRRRHGQGTKTATKDTAKGRRRTKTGHATKKAAEDRQRDGKTAAKDTGDATKTAAKDTGKGVKKGAKVVGHGVKTGAEKTDDEMKK